jgi:hypothetical protein
MGFNSGFKGLKVLYRNGVEGRKTLRRSVDYDECNCGRLFYVRAIGEEVMWASRTRGAL